MLAYAVLGLLAGRVAAHDLSMPINPLLGVPGFPNCDRLHPLRNLSVDAAAMDLRCEQQGPAEAIKIGCVGDSITAGVHSSGGIHPYPAQLQILLDKAKGKVSTQLSQHHLCGLAGAGDVDAAEWSRENTLSPTWAHVVL